MSGVKSIIFLASKLPGLPIGELILSVSDEVLQDLRKERNLLSEELCEKVKLLTALYEQYSKTEEEDTTSKKAPENCSIAVLSEIWELVLTVYVSEKSGSSHFIVNFLTMCVSRFDENGKKKCCSLLQNLLTTSLDGLTENKSRFTTVLLKTLNVIEAFLTPLHKTATGVQRSIFMFLCESVVNLNEAVNEGTFCLRLAGLLSANLRRCEDIEFCDQLWSKISDSLIRKSDLLLQGNPHHHSVILHCLVLLDLLLELVCTETADGMQKISFSETIMKSKILDLLRNPVFWLVIQKGLYHKKPALRKQAQFDLRKALLVTEHCREVVSTAQLRGALYDCEQVPIFWWDEGYKKTFDSFWKDFLLVAETLEENQLHIIRPALKKFDNLVLLASRNVTEHVFHTSWGCILLRRMVSHESKAVVREGVLRSLSLDANAFCFLQQESGEEFLFDSLGSGLIPALLDVNLFCDYKDNHSLASADAELPVVATHLEQFLQNCTAANPNPCGFLRFVLQTTTRISWSSVPLYYFTRALSLLPKVQSWASDELQTFQSLILKCSRTSDASLWHAIQTNLVQCLMRFTNCSHVRMDDIISVVTLCSVKGFFKKFPRLFDEVALWMLENFQSFLKGSQDENDFFLFTLKRIEEYCTLPSKSEMTSVEDLMKESRPIAVLILIAEKALCFQKGPLRDNLMKQILGWLHETMAKASTHLYMLKGKICKSISIIYHLAAMWLDSLSTSIAIDGYSFYTDLFKILRGMLSYTVMQVLSGRCTPVESTLFLDSWRELFTYLRKLNPECDWPLQLVGEFSSIASTSQSIYASVQMARQIKNENEMEAVLQSVHILSWLCRLAEDFSLVLDRNLSLPIEEFLSSLDLSTEIFTSATKVDAKLGKVSERYGSMIWSCVAFALCLRKDKGTANVPDSVQGLEVFLNRLDTITEYNLPVYFKALRSLIFEVLKKEEEEHELLICKCLDAGWNSVEALARSPSFRSSYRSFVSAAFQKSTLLRPAASPIQLKLFDLLSKITIHSTVKPALFRCVAEACIRSWVSCVGSEHCNKRIICQNCTVNSEPMGVHLHFLLQCLTFSHIRNKEDLASLNVLKLAGNGTNINSGVVSTDENFITVVTIAMLLRLSPRSETHCEFVAKLVCELMQFNDTLTEKRPRYHHLSLHHHMKNKIFQALILLLHFLPRQCVETTLGYLMSTLQQDAQPSVRYLMEWCLALIIARHPSCEYLVLRKLADSEVGDESGVGGAKFSAICSYMTVSLFAGHCKSDVLQEDYFLKLLDICLPWCTSQHFSIRLYALAVILRIKIFFEEIGKPCVLEERHGALLTCLLFADKATGNSGRNWIKMKDNFFLFDFHPVKDLSLESVYIILPRLCCVPSTLAAESLSLLLPGSKENLTLSSGILLFNPRASLRSRTMPKWIPQESKPTFGQDDRYRRNFGAEDLATDLASLGSGDNVQKKIMPWLEMADAAAAGHGIEKQKPPGLTVVASLIDKPSNLGGLTRTCEIFGAEALIVQSLSCTADKLYQSLAVTAHKWLPMKEVKPWQVNDYLAAMRKEGYTLVGTEQTAQSVCLSKYRFPRKCVVVLGNEKEGIPVSILKVLDVCVQIPQKGIVRSLNVHVSGAIAVWEYARQHLSAEDV